MAFSPDGKQVVSGSFDKSLKVWNTETGTELSTLNAHSDFVRAVSWSACGKWLVSGGEDKKINIYDAQTFQVKRALTVDSCVNSIAFSPDGDMIAAGCDDGTVAIVDVATVAVMRSLRGHSEDNPECICFEEE